MIEGLSPAKAWLLQLCADPLGRDIAALEQFDPQALHELHAVASRTRTLPLVAHCLERAPGVHLSLREWANALGQEARKQALASLAHGRAIVQLFARLGAAGFEPIALKGVALAFRDYPAPQLRPLRDVDILLSPDAALAAQDMLLASPEYGRAPWAGRYGLEYNHQLPELIDRSSGLVIEIHHRLNARDWPQEPQLLEMIRSAPVELELLSGRLRVPEVHANLLHLVEHATRHHTFANGPLILSDLHFMASQNVVNWERLSQDADRLGLHRSLRLLALVARRAGARWVPDWLADPSEIPESLAVAAAQAMLAPPDLVEQHLQLRRLTQRSGLGEGSLAAMSRVFRPNRYQLAALSGRSPESAAKWLGYPAWLAEKGLRYWRGRHNPDLIAARQQRDLLIDWLSG